MREGGGGLGEEEGEGKEKEKEKRPSNTDGALSLFFLQRIYSVLPDGSPKNF